MSATEGGIAPSVGTLPSLGSCPSLHSVDLSHNKLTGELPIYHLPKLDYFDLSYNALRGSVRLSVELPFGSRHVNYIGLADNEFSGSFWNVVTLGQGDDKFSEVQLKGLDISNNAFTSLRPGFCESLPTLFKAGGSRHSREARLGCHMRGSGVDADASMCAKLPQCVKDFCDSQCDDESWGAAVTESAS